ncbi:C-module-binding factor A [Fulvia fulva]|uniref:C-module-binding factor A n=1 Tax=Passalora fulva TaxID=5499 RepID=A0A9Q8UW12_PASFU|nr:C-module-binding factor A [Fulvia fulva]KAK4610464.1 C-module-binding factor A [Fulvia fulva]KAK4611416.1 C-module-binding factor A [Fulvia fulva]UJO24533.1 C-module-binding factor A [Fulvia fulva]WPV22188.1 C-module-binding factor A [Fulvia fulva]WPV37201.1 C-module-binding factor A [Fulvia fulva]
MPAQRPRASFEPIAPDFNLKALVESTPNFSYVDRISCDMIDQQGMAAFEKLVLLHVIVGGKPLVIDGFEDRLDPWTFNPKWLRDNSGDKVENARNLTAKENLPLTMGHYLKNMGLLTNQFFDKPGAYREKGRQRVYLKDIDCPQVWWDKLREHMPPALTYLNDSTGDIGGPGAQPDPHSTQPGRRLGKGIARAGDLMSSLPPDMRAENLMCYIGHEGTYTPAHREMCASLGQNIMVEASNNVSEDGKAEKPGSSIWFMTESKDRHLVSEYWLSVLGHDIEVENHFAQVVAWKKAPFSVYVVEQRPGDFILIPPLAPHQVWNRGTRTMKVAWNRTTVETLEMAINEALPRSRIVCREEQYKNKAIIYYTLQKYASLLSQAMGQAARMPRQDSDAFLYKGKIKQLFKDFKRLFDLYKQILLSEMFSPEDRDVPKNIEYVPFDSNVTCAYCRCNIFNRFLTCPNCKDLLGHQADEDGDPYDVCMDCYAMGRSCACLAGLKWVEQFRWKELASKYDTWRKLIIQLDGGQNDKSPQIIQEERRRYGKKTLAEVCKDQLKRRPFKDVKKPADEPKEDEESDEEIVVGDDGVVKKIQKKKSKAWLKNNVPCHVCCHRHPTWKMAKCTTCERSWCYGSLFRGWDKMPTEIMEDQDWSCPHCLGICFAGACRREGKMVPYEPKGTLLGHDTKKVADVRSVEALVDFSVSNLNWLRDDDPANRTQSRRFQKARAEADRNKNMDPSMELDEDDDQVDETQVEMEYSPTGDDGPIDPALGGTGAGPSSRRRQKQPAAELDEDDLARRLQEANSALPPPAAMMAGAPANGMPDGYAPLTQAGYSGYGAPPADMYGDPDASNSYHYPGYQRDGDDDSLEPETEQALRPFKKRRRSGRDGEDDGDFDEIAMSKGKKAKKPRLAAAGFRSYDLAETPDSASASRAKNEAQQQFEKEKERKALEKAKKEGRFIMLQAAMKGKKRVVKLSIPGARLAQLMAQQAAQAALTAGDDVDAEHEVEAGAAQTNGDDEDDNDLLLKSDVAPKKTPRDLQLQYAEKIREGRILTGNTKKALIPVEKDEDYGYRHRERVNGKRVDRTKDVPATAASKKEKRKSQGGRPPVEYEEVDVASDDDDFDANESGWNAVNGTAKSNRNRRSLPGYLQERHADDDPDMPDELPEGHRDKHHNALRSGRTGNPKARASDAAAQLQAETAATVKQGQVAGKAPGMRPNSSNQPIEIEDDGNSSDDDVDDAINAAANGDFGAQTNGTPVPSGSSKQPSSTGRPRGRPPKGKGVATTSPSSLKKNAAEAAVLEAQHMMEEDNRLAKLQVLEMLNDPNSPRADMSFSRAGGDLFGEDESDDGLDEAPARSMKV